MAAEVKEQESGLTTYSQIAEEAGRPGAARAAAKKNLQADMQPGGGIS